jgi:two-component system, cell cycle sensor histidine kinase and response regulator CckA
MDGPEAFGEFRRLNPEVRVVLAGGYSKEEVAARFSGMGVTGAIQEPFTRGKLRDLLPRVMPGDGYI